jgi:hypothetical protein
MNAVSYAVAIGGTSSVVAPCRAVATIRKFAAGAYSKGDLFRSSNGLHYLVLTADTYNTEPTHRTGLVAGLLATPHKTRKSIVIHNDGSVTAYLAFSEAAAVAAGIPLSADASISLAWTQAGVNAITDGAAGSLRVAEIFE